MAMHVGQFRYRGPEAAVVSAIMPWRPPCNQAAVVLCTIYNMLYSILYTKWYIIYNISTIDNIAYNTYAIRYVFISTRIYIYVY